MEPRFIGLTPWGRRSTVVELELGTGEFFDLFNYSILEKITWAPQSAQLVLRISSTSKLRSAKLRLTFGNVDNLEVTAEEDAWGSGTIESIAWDVRSSRPWFRIAISGSNWYFFSQDVRLDVEDNG